MRRLNLKKSSKKNKSERSGGTINPPTTHDNKLSRKSSHQRHLASGELRNYTVTCDHNIRNYNIVMSMNQYTITQC